jgi:hypothetical protein
MSAIKVSQILVCRVCHVGPPSAGGGPGFALSPTGLVHISGQNRQCLEGFTGQPSKNINILFFNYNIIILLITLILP